MLYNKPTLKSYTFASGTMPSSNPSLQKSMTLPTRKKESQRTTFAIRNAGESADMKVITLNKLTAKRKVKCLEIPHYA